MKRFKMLASAVVLATASVSAANTGPGSFSYEGRLYDSTTNLPSTHNVQIILQVIDPTPVVGGVYCVLREEISAPIDLSTTEGYFSVAVGTGTPQGYDPGRTMVEVFANAGSTTGLRDDGGGACTPTRSNGMGRMLRVSIKDITNSNAITALSPDVGIGSTPYAIAADSLQGFAPADLLQVNSSANVRQDYLESLLTGTGYSKLQALIAGTSSMYSGNSTASGSKIATSAGTVASPVAGSIWVDTSTNQLMVHNGSGVIAVGAGTSSGGTVTSISAGTGLNGGVITGTGTISLQNSGVSAGSYGGAGLLTTFSVDAFGRLTAAAAQALVASDITGGTLSSSLLPIVPIAKGGTNSPTALFGNRMMISSVSSVGEGPALTNGQIFIGQTGGAPLPANLTAGTGITITNSAGGITIDAVGGGISNLNGLGGASQTFATGASGTSPNWTSGGSVHTLNIPLANSGGTVSAGLISYSDWNNFNNKLGLGGGSLSGNIILPIGSAASPAVTLGSGTATGGLFYGNTGLHRVGLAINGTSVLNVTNNQMVGIGTDNPASQLDVRGSLSITSAPGYRMTLSAPPGSTIHNYYLPAVVPTAGQVMTAVSANSLGWTTVSAGSGSSGLLGLTGDVVASGTGTVAATIQSGAVTFSKFQPINYLKLVGNAMGTLGSVHEISVGTGLTMVGGTLMTTGGGSGSSYITLAGALSGTGTGTVTASINNGAVTLPKIQNITGDRLLGSGAGSSTAVQEITIGSGLLLSSGVLSATGGGTGTSGLTSLIGDVVVAGSGSNTAIIQTGVVTFPKMQTITGNRLLGSGSGTMTQVQEITIGSGLSMTGGVLSASGGTGSSVLPSLPSGMIWIGSATNSANAVLPMGDVTVSSAGVFTVNGVSGSANIGGATASSVGAAIAAMTASNAPTTLVLRDASGGFSAGSITAYDVVANSMAIINGAATVKLKHNAGASTYSLELPQTAGSSGSYLIATGPGTLGWMGGGAVGDFRADGSVSMTGALRAVPGSAGSPSFTFAVDSDTGMFSSGADFLSFATAGQQRMMISAAGNVGIGTTSPATPLDAHTSSGGTPFQISTPSGTNQLYMGISRNGTVSNIGFAPGTTGFKHYVAENVPVMFYNNATERMRIDTAGNVGIGTVAPAAKLDVYSSNFTSATPIFQTSGATSDTSGSVYGQRNMTYAQPSGAPGSNLYVYGSYTTVTGNNANLNNLTNLFGGYASATTATGSLNEAVGFSAQGSVSGASAATALTGVKANAITWSSGNVTTMTGLQVSAQNLGSGAVTTMYGIKVDTSGTATSKYGIYQNDSAAKNFFSGPLMAMNSVQTPFLMGGAMPSGTLTLASTSDATKGEVVIQGKTRVEGTIVSVPQAPGGASLNMATGNTHVVASPGGGALTLSNLVNGGNYTIIVTDPTARTYTFAGCTNTFFKPANAATSGTGRTIYGILAIHNGSNFDCYINWTTGYVP